MELNIRPFEEGRGGGRGWKEYLCVPLGMIPKFVEKCGGRGDMSTHIHGHTYSPLKKDNDHI